MEEEPHPVKEHLFNYIQKSEEKFQKLFSQTKMDKIINDILENCYEITQDNEENLGVLATGILHYMLTNAMIASQRKIQHQGIELDIVIPDIKTLEKDPKKTLIMLMPKTSDKQIIQEKLKELQKIQPEKQNIWIVLAKDLGFDNKTFVISKDGGGFSKIIFDIAQFVNVQGQNKFKILRI